MNSAFYGLGMGSPRTIAKLWTYVAQDVEKAEADEINPVGREPVWNSKSQSAGRSIYHTLRENAIENITTVGVSSLFGSIMLLFIINYIPRKQFLMYSFLWLAALFFITGASIFYVYETDMHAVSIVLIALCHFSFNLGPSSTALRARPVPWLMHQPAEQPLSPAQNLLLACWLQFQAGWICLEHQQWQLAMQQALQIHLQLCPG